VENESVDNDLDRADLGDVSFVPEDEKMSAKKK
jgi:hypothetical protein